MSDGQYFSNFNRICTHSTHTFEKLLTKCVTDDIIDKKKKRGENNGAFNRQGICGTCQSIRFYRPELDQSRNNQSGANRKELQDPCRGAGTCAQERDMKTLKQIADELGVPKQQVYRYVKSKCINEVHHEAHQSKSAKYYDEAAEQAIKEHFAGLQVNHEAHHEVHQNADEVHHETVIEVLREALETMRQDHRQEVATLKEQIERLKQDHIEELNRLQDAHRQEVGQLQRQLDTMTEELDEERQHSREQSDRLAQLADQAQRLQLAQMQPPALLDQKPPSLWQRLFGKRTRHTDDTE